jgi:hypothetical protein
LPAGSAVRTIALTELAPKPDELARFRADGFQRGCRDASARPRAPVEQAIPLLNQPEEITPGVPNHYATTCGGCTAALVVTTRDGRPIKIEGNTVRRLRRRHVRRDRRACSPTTSTA